MTCRLVTMWPCSSQTKPEPVPRGTLITSRVQKSMTRLLVVMNTTDPFQVSKTWMLERSSSVRSPRGVIGRGAASARGEQAEVRATMEPSSAQDSSTRTCCDVFMATDCIRAGGKSIQAGSQPLQRLLRAHFDRVPMRHDDASQVR